QVHLARLVRAVLAPHDRVHGELGLGGPAAEDLADPLVLVVGEPQLREGLGSVRRGARPVDGVGAVEGHTAGHGRADIGGAGHDVVALSYAARWRSTELKKPSPSVDGPVRASTACSGCGMIPTMLPSGLRIAAMPRCDPFGLPPT